MNNAIACVKNQVLPSIMACPDGNYIGDYLVLNSLYHCTLLCVLCVFCKDHIEQID